MARAFGQPDPRQLDWLLLACVGLLLALGLPLIYSGALLGDDTGPARALLVRQVLWLGVGLACGWVVLSVDYRILADVGGWLLGLGLVALVAVLLVGVEINGAKAWFRFAGLTLQPSEPTKLATLLVLAKLLGARPAGPLSARTTAASAAVVALPTALIMLQPDLGTVLSFGAMWLAMVVWAGLPLRGLLLLLGAAAIVFALAWHFGVLADYQKSRILVLFDTSVDPRGIGYHLRQSLIAVGSGGLHGHGWLQGSQTHLRFLPEAQTDFVFAVLGEEGGLVGAALVLVLYGALMWRVWGALAEAGSETGRLIVVGSGAILLFHTLLNVGMVLGLLPVTGLPLPFLSYGGSNLVTCCCLIGLVLNVGWRR